MLLALDPSLRSCGVALFDKGRLVAAGCVKSTLPAKINVLRRCLLMAEDVTDWAHGHGPYIDDLAAEWPRVYTAAKSKGSPDDLVPLAAVCGAVAALIDPRTISTYFPAEWIGQVPKVESVKGCKSSPRAAKILRRLSGDELKVWDTVKYHDTIDAIGIGLYHVGRLERRRVFSRG